jgi:hypothetical protein
MHPGFVLWCYHGESTIMSIMGLCNSPNILQEKMSELMVGLEFAMAYIHYVLVVSKGYLDTYLAHLKQVFTCLV